MKKVTLTPSEWKTWLHNTDAAISVMAARRGKLDSQEFKALMKLGVEALEQGAALARQNNGLLDRSLFHALGRTIGQNVVEIVPVRVGSDHDVEILYIRRPQSDPEWPGQLHTPGTVQRTWVGEKTYEALNRLVREELGEEADVRVLCRVEPPDTAQYEQVVPPRGLEIANVFLALVKGRVKNGEWHPLVVPPEVIKYQAQSFLPDAIAKIREMQKEGCL